MSEMLDWLLDAAHMAALVLTAGFSLGAGIGIGVALVGEIFGGSD